MDTPKVLTQTSKYCKGSLLRKSNTQQWGKSEFENSVDLEFVDDELNFNKEDTLFNIDTKNHCLNEFILRTRGFTIDHKNFVETGDDSDEIKRLITKLTDDDSTEIDEISSELRSGTISSCGTRSRGSKKINMKGRILIGSFSSTAQNSPTSIQGISDNKTVGSYYQIQ
jgi:hypothetical protein